MVSWQKTLVARLPAGSTFVTTFPFNGATIMEHQGYANVWDKEKNRKEGGGESVLSSWIFYLYLSTQDALYLKAVTVRDEFFWESHTWSHPYLDNLTYAEVLFCLFIYFMLFKYNHVGVSRVVAQQRHGAPALQQQHCHSTQFQSCFGNHALHLGTF